MFTSLCIFSCVFVFAYFFETYLLKFMSRVCVCACVSVFVFVFVSSIFFARIGTVRPGQRMRLTSPTDCSGHRGWMLSQVACKWWVMGELQRRKFQSCSQLSSTAWPSVLFEKTVLKRSAPLKHSNLLSRQLQRDAQGVVQSCSQMSPGVTSLHSL